jgi:activator of HSP90 ATPase
MKNSITHLTRRHIVGGLAAGVVSLASVGLAVAWTGVRQAETLPDKLKTSLHQEAEIHASPQQVYNALLDSKQFAHFSSMPAVISPKVGGAFSMFGGMIEGRNVALVPNKMIVQAWRPSHWDTGVYSMVKFELKPHGDGTTVVLDHTGFPAGYFGSLSEGWQLHYFEPLKKQFP